MFDAPNTKLIDLESRWRRRISVVDVFDPDGMVRIAYAHHHAVTSAEFDAGFGAPERREHDRGEAQGFAPPSEVRP